MNVLEADKFCNFYHANIFGQLDDDSEIICILVELREYNVTIEHSLIMWHSIKLYEIKPIFVKEAHNLR